MVEHRPCRKLIEVSIPLEAINTAAAVLFAQLVDDPSSWPDRFPDAASQQTERRRLHRLLEQLAPWEASTDEAILNAARWEIARCLAWRRGDEPPPVSDPAAVRRYLVLHGPAVRDPFCGGGSTLLEAQRLGLRAVGSDINPVAVLISKALVEIPSRFAGRPPVNPDARDVGKLLPDRWAGAAGLSEDLRYYGRWISREARRRIGHLYPSAVSPNGQEVPAIAWLWARTVRSPDPAAGGAHVPLASTFMLSTRRNKQSWIEPKIDRAGRNYRFVIRSGQATPDQAARARRGTKVSRGANFRCLLTGAPISSEWIRAEGKAGRLDTRLMALVVEGERERCYLPATADQESAARIGSGAIAGIDQPMPANPRWFAPPDYGFPRFRDLFTHRQFTALATFSDLIAEARERIENDARATGLSADNTPLHSGGVGATAYADAVATYLAFALSKLADRGSSICTWFTERDSTRPTFARQAIPMTWDFAELNPLLSGTGSFEGAVQWTAESLEAVPDQAPGGRVRMATARVGAPSQERAVISTDPPYYDNIGYADLSDFFYLWLRRCLGGVWPDLLGAELTPKEEELVATPYRHGGKAGAEAFFIAGMSRALRAMQQETDDSVPLTIYYAFKQSEAGKEGIASPGWASFLQSVIDSGLAVLGTWPLRTELGNRMTGVGTNALASSIVLVCRKRVSDAGIVERESFVRALRRELPNALAAIRAAGVGPVDLAQSAIGPGMSAFTRHKAVLEYSGKRMTVRTALGLINQVLDELQQDDDPAYDLATRFAVDWFAEVGWEPRTSGDAILVANARNLGFSALIRSGIVVTEAGKTRLARREEMPGRGGHSAGRLRSGKPRNFWPALLRPTMAGRRKRRR
jgi:putative DNA methylase